MKTSPVRKDACLTRIAFPAATGKRVLSILSSGTLLMGAFPASLASAVAVSGAGREPISPDVPQVVPGGWSAASAEDAEARKAAKYAVSAQAKALRKSRGGPAAQLELVKVIEVRRQVVAGVNYEILMRVKHDGAEKKAKAVVWWQAWRQPDPYKLTSWDWVEQGR